MLVATTIAIFFIPLFFYLIQGLADRVRRGPPAGEEAEA